MNDTEKLEELSACDNADKPLVPSTPQGTAPITASEERKRNGSKASEATKEKGRKAFEGL